MCAIKQMERLLNNYKKESCSVLHDEISLRTVMTAIEANEDRASKMMIVLFVLLDGYLTFSHAIQDALQSALQRLLAVVCAHCSADP